MKSVITVVAVTFLTAASVPAIAQSAHEGHHATSQGSNKTTSKMSSGTVKKLDPATDRITIAHGPLENLNMPPMTMAFKVQDRAMLSMVKPGDKIDFNAADIDGTLTVTAIERSK
jgi:Cu(I)/Ag(I) efflux system protein CusF